MCRQSIKCTAIHVVIGRADNGITGSCNLFFNSCKHTMGIAVVEAWFCDR